MIKPKHNQPRTGGTSISFVIPCLNEVQTLPSVLGRIRQLQETTYRHRLVEVIVADNGSTDGSVACAKQLGAKVIACPIKGYGAALAGGITAAVHDIVVFADADNTYDFLETPKLVNTIEAGADLVLGSRLSGTMEPGSMPWLHRYLGTPVLSFLINMLYVHGQQHISDCNSGFRAFRRSLYVPWAIRSTGMEFASEMLIKALKAGSVVTQVPISFRRDHRQRTPHLQTWRDGMRHLLQILLGAPAFFNFVGSLIAYPSWVMLFVALVSGPFKIGPVSVFGIHTMMFSLLGSHVGITIWGIGLLLAAKQPSGSRLYRWLLNMREDRLFWSLAFFFLFSTGMLALVIINWARHDFQVLALEKQTLAIIACASTVLLLGSHVTAGHLVKRS